MKEGRKDGRKDGKKEGKMEGRKENINTKYYIIRSTIKEKGHITC